MSYIQLWIEACMQRSLISEKFGQLEFTQEYKFCDYFWDFCARAAPSVFLDT